MADIRAFFVTVSCVVRGYHVYKEIWKPDAGEEFVCRTEEGNVHDRKAVAVCSPDGTIVGHLPHEISNLCFHFIQHGGEIVGETTGTRQHTKADCGGMEIPCLLTLSGKKKLVEKAKGLIVGHRTNALPLEIVTCNV